MEINDTTCDCISAYQEIVVDAMPNRIALMDAGDWYPLNQYEAQDSGTPNAMDAYKCASKLADIQAYIAAMAEKIGWDLVDIMDLSIEKLTEEEVEEAVV